MAYRMLLSFESEKCKFPIFNSLVFHRLRSMLKPIHSFFSFFFPSIFWLETTTGPLMAIYNRGKNSAATQPHRHLQFVPLKNELSSAPILEVISKHEKEILSQGGDLTSPTLLPFPYVHLYLPLQHSSSSPPKNLYEMYLKLLEASPASAASSNLILTTTGISIVPRTTRDVFIPRENEADLVLGPNSLGFAGRRCLFTHFTLSLDLLLKSLLTSI